MATRNPVITHQLREVQHHPRPVVGLGISGCHQQYMLCFCLKNDVCLEIGGENEFVFLSWA